MAPLVKEKKSGTVVLGGDFSEPHVKETFELWHQCVKNRDLGAMRPRIEKVQAFDMAEVKTTVSYLAPSGLLQNCTFHSPTVGRPFEGVDALCIVLESVGEVGGSPPLPLRGLALQPCAFGRSAGRCSGTL
jgi:hypothetical protein